MIIKLKEYGTTLVSRELAMRILKSFELEDDKLELDFSMVETVTPSFSHELLSGVLGKNPKIKHVELLNANNSVTLQLKKALVSVKKDKEEFNH